MTHHMSLKNLRDYSVTFDENKCTEKHYAKILKNADKVRKLAFQSKGHGLMIGADFGTFWAQIPAISEVLCSFFSLSGLTLAYNLLFSLFLSLEIHAKIQKTFLCS